MSTVYHLRSHCIDAIPKALSLLRRRLIVVTDFTAHTSEDGIFDAKITVDILDGHEERFLHLFEKILEIEIVEWWHDTEV